MFECEKKKKTRSHKLTAITYGGVNTVNDNEQIKSRSGLKVAYTHQVEPPATCSFVRQISHRSPVRVGDSTYQCVFDIYKRDFNVNHEIYLTMYSQTNYKRIHIYQGELNPENLNCIAIESTPTKGCGVYLLISEYQRSSCKLSLIYELGYDLQTLYDIYDTNIESPTILKHGRGTLWLYAEESVIKQLKEPEQLQSMNCLNGAFTAKYRTDGISREFSLPLDGLANTKITVLMYGADGTRNTWVIDENSSVSNAQNVLTLKFDVQTQTFNRINTNVEIRVNRSIGTITAYVSGTQNQFSLPFSNYGDDNLIVTANCSTNAVRLLMQSDEFFCVPSGDNGGKMTVLINSQSNRMFCSTHDNPLYYPQNNSFLFVCNVADGYSVNYCGTTVFLQMGYLIYIIRSISTVKSGGVTISNTLNIIKSEGQVHQNADFSVRAVADRVYFLDKNGRICSISGTASTGQIKREYKSIDTANDDIWSLEYDGKYLCCVGNKGYFADKDEPEFQFGGKFDDYERIGLNGSLMKKDNSVLSLVIDGVYDELPNDEYIDVERINTRYKLENQHCGTHSKKNFYLLKLVLENPSEEPKKCMLTLTDINGRTITRSVTADKGRTISNVYFRLRTQEINVQLDFSHPVVLCSGTMYYTV